MSEPETILAATARLLAPEGPLNGKRVLITAGPTREHIDPMRVITNPSSGRMGYALAEAASARGAEVLLVTGPTALPLPVGATAHRVETTAEMQRAVQALVKRADVLIMAAAPADYRPAASATVKRPRTEGTITLELVATPDILRSLERPKGCVIVGFALETGGDGVAQARQKLQDKAVDLGIFKGGVGAGAGFEVATNRVTIVRKSGAPTELPLLSKRDVAERILDEVEQTLS